MALLVKILKKGLGYENLCRKANIHIPAVCGVCGVPVWHGVFEEYPGAGRGVADAYSHCPGRYMAGGGKVEREAVRMDTTDFMQKLSQKHC